MYYQDCASTKRTTWLDWEVHNACIPQSCNTHGEIARLYNGASISSDMYTVSAATHATMTKNRWGRQISQRRYVNERRDGMISQRYTSNALHCRLNERDWSDCTMNRWERLSVVTVLCFVRPVDLPTVHTQTDFFVLRTEHVGPTVGSRRTKHRGCDPTEN